MKISKARSLLNPIIFSSGKMPLSYLRWKSLKNLAGKQKFLIILNSLNRFFCFFQLGRENEQWLSQGSKSTHYNNSHQFAFTECSQMYANGHFRGTRLLPIICILCLNKGCISASFRSNLLYGVRKADTARVFPTFFYIDVLTIKNTTL